MIIAAHFNNVYKVWSRSHLPAAKMSTANLVPDTSNIISKE